jgi:hypothetical protein
LAYLVQVEMHGAREGLADHRKPMRTSSGRLPIGIGWSYSVSNRTVQSRAITALRTLADARRLSLEVKLESWRRLADTLLL